MHILIPTVHHIKNVSISLLGFRVSVRNGSHMVIVLPIWVPAFNLVRVEQRNVCWLIWTMHWAFDSWLGRQRWLVGVLSPALSSSVTNTSIQVKILNHMRVSLLTETLSSISFPSLRWCKDLRELTLVILDSLNFRKLERLLLAECITFKFADELNIVVSTKHLLVWTQRFLTSVHVQAALELYLTVIW